MWSLLVGLLERWWREKPRLDVVRTVVRLRNSMTRCHQNYVTYDSLRRQGVTGDTERAQAEWVSSVDNLARILEELDVTFEIFSPEAHQALIYYRLSETGAVNAWSRLAVVESDLVGKTDENSGAFLEAANIHSEGGVGSDFLAAKAALDAFIAKQFKPDEVFAVQNSRWR